METYTLALAVLGLEREEGREGGGGAAANDNLPAERTTGETSKQQRATVLTLVAR